MGKARSELMQPMHDDLMFGTLERKQQQSEKWSIWANKMKIKKSVIIRFRIESIMRKWNAFSYPTWKIQLMFHSPKYSRKEFQVPWE